ncbi:MAG: VWA domain-containing protein [Leptospiraceae bacterium]|nr:VWA domain-containing protein [Leptospiraceae bacterium]
MKKIKSLLPFIIFFLSINVLFSKEVTFLPSYIVGEPPKVLKAKDNLKSGIAELTAFYAREHFYIDITNFSEIKNFILESKETTDKRPTKTFLSRVCSEFETDYLVRSEVDFGHVYSISTEVYNCQGETLFAREDFLKNKFYEGIESHIQKILHFFPPREGYKKNLYEQSEEQEYIFAIDLSGSLSNEVKGVLNYIQKILGNSKLAIGAILIQQNKIQIFNPDFNHTKLRKELLSVRYGGDVYLKNIATAVQKFKRQYKPSRAKSRKFILVSDALPENSSDNSLSFAVASLRSMGLPVSILTGSFFSHRVMSLYKQAANQTGSPLYQITHAQTIGTGQGYRTIYLHDTHVYYEDSSQVDINRTDFKKLQKLEESDVYSKVDFLHPGNMLYVYSNTTKDKVLEKGKMLSNVTEQFESILESQNGKMKTKSPKVLLKSDGFSYWLNVKSLNHSFINKEVFIKTTFINDSFSSTGFTNLPNDTYIYNENVPKLLVMSSKEIGNSLKNNKHFTCFIRGVILEMK